MNYPRSWDEATVRKVFTTESRQKAQDLFLATHRPFRRIRVDFSKEGDVAARFIAEEDLCAILHAGSLDDDNRLFFVVGEAGCGKSELCQWLEYSVDRRTRLPVHIPRSMTTAAHVAALVQAQLAAIEGNAGLGLRRGTPAVTQARHVAYSAALLLYERAPMQLKPSHAYESLLTSDALIADLVAYFAGASSSVDHALLPDTRIADLCARHGIPLDPAALSETATEVRSLVVQAHNRMLLMGDLRALLADLSERVVDSGRRPLLLIEDITAFQAVGDVLLDYLLDLTSGHFDAIIGVTTGFERTQLAKATLDGDLTHIHHRLRARFVLTDEHGYSYGLEEDLIEFARAYLRAAKVMSSAHTADTSSWSPPGFDPDLYPFTATALRRAYENLQEEGNPRRTPRLFLEHVLGAVLLAPDIPPLTLDRSPYLRRPPAYFRRDQVQDEGLQSLVRWYGEVGDNVVSLDRRVAACWDLAVPNELMEGDVVRAARPYVLSSPDAPAGGAEWHQAIRELQRWLDVGGIYPSRETLKRGVERALLNLGDPRALGSRDALSPAKAEIYYARGDERLPILLDGDSGDLPSPDSVIRVHVTRDPEERGILEELAYVELGGARLSQVCQNLAATLEWAQGHWDSFHRRAVDLLSERLDGIQIEALILVGWRLLASLCGMPWSETPHVRAWDRDEKPYPAASPWSASAHAACYRTGETLAGWHEQARRLFIGAFTLRDSLLDLERYQGTSEHLDSSAVLRTLSYLPLKPLRTLPYKIRPGGEPLYDLLVALQRYAQALMELDVDTALRVDAADLAVRDRHLRAQMTMDLDALHHSLEALRWRCGEVGVPWRQVWDAPMDTLRRLSLEHLWTLHAQVRHLRRDAAALRRAPSPDVWAYQDFRHRIGPVLRQPYWQAEATVQAIREEVLAAAGVRYRSHRRVLTGTRAYQELLGTVRTIRQELSDARPIADRRFE